MGGVSIAVDALGGDLGPGVVIDAAIRYAEDHPEVQIRLVGDRGDIDPCIAASGLHNIRSVHAPTAAGMKDSPALLVARLDPQISVVRAAQLVHQGLIGQGGVDGAVSIGNSGACMVAARGAIGCLPGIERPALAIHWPNLVGRPVIVLDVGANVDCVPEMLTRFAEIGRELARHRNKIADPTVGLLTIGAEQCKGNKAVKDAASLIRNRLKCKVLNVEPNTLSTKPLVDVVVCDGFVGNIALKAGEGAVELTLRTLEEVAKEQQDLRRSLPAIKSLVLHTGKRLKYESYGAADLLGIKGVFLVGHGCSNEKAVYTAIDKTRLSIESNFLGSLQVVNAPEAVAA